MKFSKIKTIGLSRMPEVTETLVKMRDGAKLAETDELICGSDLLVLK